MIHIVLLAAGFASRYGSNKLLAMFRGRPMIRYALDPLLSFCRMHPDDADLMIVTQYDEIAALAESEQIPFAINPDPARGLSSSILCGFAALNRGDRIKEGDYLAFFAGDMPLLRKETIHGFLLHLLREKPSLAAVGAGDQFGIPAALSTAYLAELLSLSGDRGAKSILNAHPEELSIYPVKDRSELQDIDEKEE